AWCALQVKRATVPAPWACADRRRPTVASRREQADPGVPVGQRGAGAAAFAERGGLVLGQGAGLADVLAGDPDVLAVDGGCAVVAPAGSGGARRVAERLVLRGAVLRAEAGPGDEDGAGSGAAIEGGVRGGREEAVADQGEGHHAPAVGVD